jgi:hypothetical protein
VVLLLSVSANDNLLFVDKESYHSNIYRSLYVYVVIAKNVTSLQYVSVFIALLLCLYLMCFSVRSLSQLSFWLWSGFIARSGLLDDY